MIVPVSSKFDDYAKEVSQTTYQSTCTFYAADIILDFVVVFGFVYNNNHFLEVKYVKCSLCWYVVLVVGP